MNIERLLASSVVAIVLVTSVALSVGAQEKAKPAPGGAPKATAQEPDAKGQPAAKADVAAPAIPDDVALNILVRRTLMTVNDANLSGNYSVLRDLAAPGFQAKNDPQKLAELFAKFRSRNLDLAPIVYFTPRLVRKPELTKDGALRLTGFIPTKPQQVNFDMAFVHSEGRWRLDAIAVNAVPAQAAAASPAPADTANKQGGTAASKSEAGKKK